MNDKKTNVLIIGGLGFIGWNLAKHLLSLGEYNVNILDKKPQQFSDYDYSGLYTLYATETQSIDFVESDIEDFYIDDGMGLERADVVFHFGEYSRVEKSIENENEFRKVVESNIAGTGNVILKYVSQLKDALFFYAGSSTRFSDYDAYKQSPYAFTKYSNAELIKCLSKWGKYKTGVIYFYNVFGDGELDGDMGTVVAKFKKSYFNNEKIKVFGGKQTRRFTYVGDVVRNITYLMKETLALGLNGDEFHMVSPSTEEISISDLAKMFYDDDKMIDYQPERRGCRERSIDQDFLERQNWFGDYNVSVSDYVNLIKEKI